MYGASSQNMQQAVDFQFNRMMDDRGVLDNVPWASWLEVFNDDQNKELQLISSINFVFTPCFMCHEQL